MSSYAVTNLLSYLVAYMYFAMSTDFISVPFRIWYIVLYILGMWLFDESSLLSITNGWKLTINEPNYSTGGVQGATMNYVNF